MVSILGDGEKCKRVNLRCGEKVEKSEKQKAAEGGGEGVKGESTIPTSAQGSARDWISG